VVILDMEYRDDDSFDREDLEKEAIERERLEQERVEREMLERQRLEQERLERDRLESERLERERLEKERFEQLKMESKVYPNYSLFMIPSWSDLLGYPTLGTYVNHPVSRIEADPVIFFSSYDYSIDTPKGTLHYLFGLGYYFLKFELESGKYVTDNRVLTGLVLSDFAYDLMATSANVTLEEDRDVVIAEKVVKVPVDLSNKSEDHLTFIKGALMRNVFIPNKAIFLEMMERISIVDSYDVSSEGHKILSAHRDFFNQLLVSEKINPNSTYLNPTAGLEGVHIVADNLLEDTISSINLEIIEESINVLKQVYSNLEYDPMSLFSILEHAAPLLSSVASRSVSEQTTTQPKGTIKNSIFVSAEDRLYAFSKWPVEFVRKAKIEPKPLPKLVEEPSITSDTLDHVDIKSTEFRSVVPREMELEQFELDTLKSETVEFKPLPPPPEADIKKILLYLKKVIEENYEMRTIGQAFELAREVARQMGVSATTLHQAKIWEMSKYANIYIKKESGLGLPEKEKGDLIRKVNEWQFEIEERERLERERLERERLEKERLERLERERIERERLEKERQERERLERIRLEKERAAQEQLEKERLAKIQKEKEEALRLERERIEEIERQKEEQLRLERERLEKEKAELEAIEKEKQELKRLKKERNQKEKEAKKEAKKRKKLEKQKKKLEKKKLKEQEKLKNL
jgi:hypothetical protein